jgi:HD-like signal output (HDOD) protein
MQSQAVGEHAILDAYRSGLFHDSGKPLAVSMLLDIEKQMSTVRGRRVLTDEMLVTCVDRAHAIVGARLARAWGLSPEVAAAIEIADQPGGAVFDLGAAVRLANALAFQGGFHTRRDELDRSRLLVDNARRAAGIHEETCHRVLDGLRDTVARRL